MVLTSFQENKISCWFRCKEDCPPPPSAAQLTGSATVHNCNLIGITELSSRPGSFLSNNVDRDSLLVQNVSIEMDNTSC